MTHDSSPPAGAPPGAASATALPIIPPDIKELLGRPPLLRGEVAADYWRIFERLALERSPRDYIEWLYLKDVVDALWEERRCRRMRDALIDRGIPAAAAQILHDAEGEHFSEAQVKRGFEFVTQGMMRGDAEDAETVDETLASAGLTRDALAAAAFAEQIDTLERLSRMADTCGRRRRNATSDAERHRFALMQQRPDARGAVTDLDPASVIHE
jgi:hypothetical protein